MADDVLDDLGPAPIPVRSLVLSFSALIIPVTANVAFADAARDHEVLLWLLALIPAFLLAYYRGWKGVAVAMASGMVVLTITHLFLVITERQIGNWPLLLSVVTSYVAIGLGLGAVTELLHRERERVQRLALVDPLTGAPNRRHSDLILGRAFASAQRGMPLVVVLFDLDRFKLYNDEHGHHAGDLALKAFTNALLRNTRTMNLSSRHGGEEFLSILNNSTEEGALVFVDRVREAVRANPPPAGPFTVCAGLASYDVGMGEPGELVAAADTALYAAKSAGRNQVKVFSRLTPEELDGAKAAAEEKVPETDQFRTAGPLGSIPVR